MDTSQQKPFTEMLKVERGNVVKDSTGQKRVIKVSLELDPSEWELVSKTPHEDGDFSYLCTNQFCRCYS